MSETISPFGGENLPFKELEKQKVPPRVSLDPEKEKKDKSKIYTIALMMVIAFLLMIIILMAIGVFSKKPEPVTPSPTPVLISPSPVATISAIPRSVYERLDNLEKSLNEVDLQQTQYAFPFLDFNLSFENK